MNPVDTGARRAVESISRAARADGQVVAAQQLRRPGQDPGPVLRPRRHRRRRVARGGAAQPGQAAGADLVLGDLRRRRG